MEPTLPQGLWRMGKTMDLQPGFDYWPLKKKVVVFCFVFCKTFCLKNGMGGGVFRTTPSTHQLVYIIQPFVHEYLKQRFYDKSFKHFKICCSLNNIYF